VTTSILDSKELQKLLGEVEKKWPNTGTSIDEVPKPVSLDELIDRLNGLLTPAEAEAMERTIEESCERLDD
jgi:hypothetical protein